MPPSSTRRPPITGGAKMLGKVMLARMASAKDPPRMTTASPVDRSVATHTNGMGSRLKSLTSGTCQVRPFNSL